MRRRRKRRSYKRIIILGLFLALLPFLLLGGYFALFGKIAPTKPLEQKEDFLASDTAMNILLLGIDRRNDDVGRSDTMLILTVDMTKNSANILSIPRDTRVAIAENGYDKINHAYAFGGHELSIKTVENLLAAPVDRYALIDIASFVKIIDILGGVKLNVERPMHYEDPWDDDGGLVIDFKPGWQHLDGKKSIEYVRYRDEDGDLGRIGRQQHFAKELLEQTSAAKIVLKLPQLLRTANEAIVTDLTLLERCRLATFLARLPKDNLTSSMLAGRPAYLGNVSYWLPDLKVARHQMAEAMDAPESPSFQVSAIQLAADYAKELPKTMALAELPKEMQEKKPDKPAPPSKDSQGGKDNKGTISPKAAKPDNKSATPPVQTGQTAKLDRRAEDRLDMQTAAQNTAAPSANKESSQKKKIRVTVVNSSGINGAGARAARILRSHGFEVLEPQTGKNHLDHTRIVAADSDVMEFYGMPFACIIIGGGDAGEAFVNIGADFSL